MIQTQGEVIALHDGRADVRLEVATACSACKSKDGCSGGVERTITVDAPVNTHLGDRVTLSMNTAQLHLGGLLGYFLPALATLLGAILGADGGDASSALGAGLGLIAGLLAVRLLSRAWAGGNDLPVACSTDASTEPDSPLSTIHNGAVP